MGLFRDPIFLAAGLILILVEWGLRRLAGRSYSWGGAFASLGVAIGDMVSRLTGGVVIGLAALAIARLSPWHWPLDDWRSWVVGFFGVEFAYYWFHRWSHEVRWLWATHNVHHSAAEFTFPAAIRLGWTSLVSGGWIVYMPLVMAGMDPVMLATLLGLNLKYQFLLHTELVGRLGPLEWVFNTPAHHRIHHACNAAYLDRNYGGVLIVFDRLFGTFAEERPDEPVRYGLTEPLESRNPFIIAFREWQWIGRDLKAARSFRDIRTILFGRPGAFRGAVADKKMPRSGDRGIEAVSGGVARKG